MPVTELVFLDAQHSLGLTLTVHSMPKTAQQGIHFLSNVCHSGIKPKPRPLHRAPKGCPCTPQLLCSTDERGVFNEFCDIPRAPVSTFSMHGGAGGIMSVGLMRAVSFDFMEMCVKSLYSTGKLHSPSGLRPPPHDASLRRIH